jgi:hypothetical protein
MCTHARCRSVESQSFKVMHRIDVGSGEQLRVRLVTSAGCRVRETGPAAAFVLRAQYTSTDQPGATTTSYA